MKRKVSEKRVTLKDIAARLGLSDRAISEALRDDKEKVRVSDATRKRVRAAAKRMGYQRNWAARALRTRRSGTFAIMSFSALNHFMMGAMFHARERFISHGITPLVFDCRNDSAAIDSTLNFMADAKVNGVLMLKPPPIIDQAVVHRLWNSGIAVTAFGGNWLDGIPRFTADTTAGFSNLVATLAKSGFKDIQLILQNKPKGADRHRQSVLNGFISAAETCRTDYNIAHAIREISIEYHTPKNLNSDAEPHPIHCIGYELMKRVLREPGRPDVAMFPADESAAGALRACHELKVKVPEDIAITGFQNNPSSSAGYIPITSVSQPTEKLCSSAVDHLLDIAKKHLFEDDVLVELPCKLHLRASTGHGN